MYDLIGATAAIAPTAVNLGVLLTGLLLGIRHGIDWDHIAAITDITSTTAATGMADAAHAGQHREISGHSHGHGGAREIRAHDAGPGGATLAPALAARPIRPRRQWLSGQGDAIRLGSLYALGHAPWSSPSAWPPSRSAPSCRTGSIRSWPASSASPWSHSACG